MNVTQRSYRSEVDLSAMLALKQLCTTPQLVFDSGYLPIEKREVYSKQEQKR